MSISTIPRAASLRRHKSRGVLAALAIRRFVDTEVKPNDRVTFNLEPHCDDIVEAN